MPNVLGIHCIPVQDRVINEYVLMSTVVMRYEVDSHLVLNHDLHLKHFVIYNYLHLEIMDVSFLERKRLIALQGVSACKRFFVFFVEEEIFSQKSKKSGQYNVSLATFYLQSYSLV